MCGGGYAPPTTARLFAGYALGSGLALHIIRPEGIAQNVKGTPTAGHSHRRTSGGKAAAALTGGPLGQSLCCGYSSAVNNSTFQAPSCKTLQAEDARRLMSHAASTSAQWDLLHLTRR